ncbi:MAG TPA: hypothetical protein VJL87_01745 [Bdellovibrionota bacterium]|nr:hypothetical protein [Bdellovibrionota bacterium]
MSDKSDDGSDAEGDSIIFNDSPPSLSKAESLTHITSPYEDMEDEEIEEKCEVEIPKSLLEESLEDWYGFCPLDTVPIQFRLEESWIKKYGRMTIYRSEKVRRCTTLMGISITKRSKFLRTKPTVEAFRETFVKEEYDEEDTSEQRADSDSDSDFVPEETVANETQHRSMESSVDDPIVIEVEGETKAPEEVSMESANEAVEAQAEDGEQENDIDDKSQVSQDAEEVKQEEEELDPEAEMKFLRKQQKLAYRDFARDKLIFPRQVAETHSKRVFREKQLTELEGELLTRVVDRAGLSTVEETQEPSERLIETGVGVFTDLFAQGIGKKRYRNSEWEVNRLVNKFIKRPRWRMQDVIHKNYEQLHYESPSFAYLETEQMALETSEAYEKFQEQQADVLLRTMLHPLFSDHRPISNNRCSLAYPPNLPSLARKMHLKGYSRFNYLNIPFLHEFSINFQQFEVKQWRINETLLKSLALFGFDPVLMMKSKPQLRSAEEKVKYFCKIFQEWYNGRSEYDKQLLERFKANHVKNLKAYGTNEFAYEVILKFAEESVMQNPPTIAKLLDHMEAALLQAEDNPDDEEQDEQENEPPEAITLDDSDSEHVTDSEMNELEHQVDSDEERKQ